jgi:hypothetical protein
MGKALNNAYNPNQRKLPNWADESGLKFTDSEADDVLLGKDRSTPSPLDLFRRELFQQIG